MYINYFKNAVTNNFEQIEVEAGRSIESAFPKGALDNSVIYVNGFPKDSKYILKENDLCTIRKFPEGFLSNLINNVVGGVTRTAGSVVSAVEQVFNTGTTHGQNITSFGDTTVNQGLGSAIRGVTNNYITQVVQQQVDYNDVYNHIKDDINRQITINTSDYNKKLSDLQTSLTDQIGQVNTNKQVVHQDVRGCPNGSALNNPYPFVIGKSYCSPSYICQPYTTPADAKGHRITYHALYLVAVNSVNVTDICLGLKKLASNSGKLKSGLIPIDGDYDSNKYAIQLEIQNENEVSLFSQKVIQQDINTELVHPVGTDGLVLEEFSSPYPQKVEVEIGIDGLVGVNANKKEDVGTVTIKLEYSTDGGSTWKDFGSIGSGTGITHNANEHTTTISMKEYESMRLVATKTFTPNEILNATNHVIEIRANRVTVHKDDKFVYDTVTLKAIRTYCYDPELSSVSALVSQAPMCERDRRRTTRIGFTITTDDVLYDLKQFNCVVQALGRTCTESNGYYTWSNSESETCNPASMALKVLQSSALGTYAYTDAEIDMQSFGELYKFCNDYQIHNASGNLVGLQANGIITRQAKLADWLDKILAVGRAFRIYNGNKIGVFIDKPIETTTLILNNQNVLQASNAKNFDELPSGLKATFVNEDNYFQNDIMYIDYPDAPARTSMQYTTMAKTFDFETNVEQIKKNGLFYLAKLKLRPETWMRKVTSEGCLAFIGAKIEIQDDTICVGIGDGAEIIDFVYDDAENPRYIQKIITDGQFDVTDLSEAYGIRIQCAGNGIRFATRSVVINEAGIYNEFVLENPISLSENIIPTVGDIISFGVYTKITYETICIGKTDNGDGTFDLSLVPYVEAIYSADSGTLPEFNSKVTVPSVYRRTRDTKTATKEDVQKVKDEIESGTTTAPNDPTNFTVTAYENYLEMKCVQTGNTLKDTIKYYEFEITRRNGIVQNIKSGSNNFNYLFKRDVDFYPEASDLAQWSFRVRVTNVYDISSNWVTATQQSVDLTHYGTWQIPEITVTKEIVDRTVILTATYGGSRTVYGKLKTLVKIKRSGNLDTQDNKTFNEILGITPDAQYYTPEFDRSVQTSTTADNEPHYRKDTTTAYETPTTKISHTLPLIGQTYRIFKGTQNTGVFTKDVEDYSTVPQSPTTDLVIHYIGDDIEGFAKDGYYQFDGTKWEQVFSRAMIVPTTYYYVIQMTNESGNVSNSVEIEVTALCTNIADLVHSHEHYKDLYVEKLSAINANIGLITQGGFGSFKDLLNYWALSDLSAEDSGVAGGVKKGSFRVGGQDQYLQVEPDVQHEGEYIITLKAGNITLTSGTDATFKQGTFIYDKYDDTKRLALTSNGIIAQRNVGTALNANWKDVAKVYADNNSNMIITNSENNAPMVGIHATGDIYHFDSDKLSESGTNPQNITADGDIISTSDENPILSMDSSKGCLKGTITKDISQYTGEVVLFSTSDIVIVGNKRIDTTGDVEDFNEADTYNTLMSQTKDEGTVGSYLGLSAEQISSGIFEDYIEE